jgi:hypothetical protein
MILLVLIKSGLKPAKHPTETGSKLTGFAHKIKQAKPIIFYGNKSFDAPYFTLFS